MHAIWIEIPVTDLDRAAEFYRSVFGHPPTDVVDDGVRRITVIDGQPSVSLNQTDGFEPTAQGSIPYFQVADLDRALERAQALGAKQLEPPTERPGLGRFALVLDSEGNSIYLHGDA